MDQHFQKNGPRRTHCIEKQSSTNHSCSKKKVKRNNLFILFKPKYGKYFNIMHK